MKEELEKAKKDLKETIDSLKEEYKGSVEKIQEEIDEKIKKGIEEHEWNDKMHEETKAELDKLVKDHNDKFEELKKKTDEIQTKLNRPNFKNGSDKKQSFNDVMKSIGHHKEWAEGLNKFREDPQAGFTLKFDFGVKDDEKHGANVMSYKASDMTSSNTFTNDVFDVTRRTDIIFDPDRNRYVRELLPGGTMTGNAYEYIQETAYDDQAAATSEGSAPTQSDFDLTQQSAPAVKIVATMVITEEMLDDVQGMATYLGIRVPGKIRVAEDNQLLYGTGVSPQGTGITVAASDYTDRLALGSVQEADVLRSAIGQVRDDEYMANVILIHPNDMEGIELLKDANNNYIFPSMLTGVPPMISGVRIFETTAITDGDFLVGDFSRGAAVFDRQASFIRFYEQHSTNAAEGKIFVKAQERLAFPVWRTSAFIYGTFAEALAQGTS